MVPALQGRGAAEATCCLAAHVPALLWFSGRPWKPGRGDAEGRVCSWEAGCAIVPITPSLINPPEWLPHGLCRVMCEACVL